MNHCSQQKTTSSTVSTVFFLTLVLLSAVVLCSCEKIKSPFGNETGNSPATAVEPVQAEGSAQLSPDQGAANKCASGKAPQVLTGNCTGVWTVVPNGSTSTCVFEWGPMVKCPAGATAIGYDSVCYGVTEKNLPAGANATLETCAKQFGATPSNPAYMLTCCGE